MVAVAIVVYEKGGLAILCIEWVNLDLIWVAVLIAAGPLCLLVIGGSRLCDRRFQYRDTLRGGIDHRAASHQDNHLRAGVAENPCSQRPANLRGRIPRALGVSRHRVHQSSLACNASVARPSFRRCTREFLAIHNFAASSRPHLALALLHWSRLKRSRRPIISSESTKACLLEIRARRGIRRPAARSRDRFPAAIPIRHLPRTSARVIATPGRAIR
jgi:hypothetical protein